MRHRERDISFFDYPPSYSADEFDAVVPAQRGFFARVWAFVRDVVYPGDKG